MTKANTELDRFKQLVYDTAKKYGKRYDWCDVIDDALYEMGLDDYFPEVFRIQSKSSARAQWSTQSWSVPYHAENSARNGAKEARKRAIAEAQRLWDCNNQYNAVDNSIQVSIESTDEEIIAARKEIVKKLKAREKFVEPKYPIYRAVVMKGRKVIRVLEEE